MISMRFLVLFFLAGTLSQAVCAKYVPEERTVTKIKIIGADNQSDDNIRIEFGSDHNDANRGKGFFLANHRSIDLNLDIIMPAEIILKTPAAKHPNRDFPETLPSKYFDKNGVVKGRIRYISSGNFYFDEVLPS